MLFCHKILHFRLQNPNNNVIIKNNAILLPFLSNTNLDRKGKIALEAKTKKQKTGYFTKNLSLLFNGNSDEETESEEVRTVTESGCVTVQKGEYLIHCMTVIGQIEGHYILPAQNKTTKYEHVIPQLVAIEESDEIDGLIMILNTVGGDIEAGLAIAELISGMRKPKIRPRPMAMSE